MQPRFSARQDPSRAREKETILESHFASTNDPDTRRPKAGHHFFFFFSFSKPKQDIDSEGERERERGSFCAPPVPPVSRTSTRKTRNGERLRNGAGRSTKYEYKIRARAGACVDLVMVVVVVAHPRWRG